MGLPLNGLSVKSGFVMFKFEFSRNDKLNGSNGLLSCENMIGASVDVVVGLGVVDVDVDENSVGIVVSSEDGIVAGIVEGFDNSDSKLSGNAVHTTK